MKKVRYLTMRIPLSALGLLSGATIGFIVSVSLPASATRNSVGTYTLPGGNPVVSGTTISSTWANNTLGDLASEMTNSLDRQGRGAMLAPLRLQAGTASAPALTFSADPDTGLYRAGNDDVRMQVDGSQSMQFSSTGTFTPGVTTTGTLVVNGVGNIAGDASVGGTLSVTGNTSLAGLAVSGASTFAQPATLNSGGPALVLKPGVADHTYAEFYADTAAPTSRSGFIGYASAGSSDFAIANSMTGGKIIFNTPGQIVANSTINLATSNPAASASFTNTLTPKNVIKAWARVVAAGNGSQSVVIEDGFNVSGASVQSGTGYLELNLATPMSSPNYTVQVTGGSRYMSCGLEITAASLLRVGCKDLSSNLVPLPDINFQTNTSAIMSRLHIVVIGAQ